MARSGKATAETKQIFLIRKTTSMDVSKIYIKSKIFSLLSSRLNSGARHYHFDPPHHRCHRHRWRCYFGLEYPIFININFRTLHHTEINPGTSSSSSLLLLPCASYRNDDHQSMYDVRALQIWKRRSIYRRRRCEPSANQEKQQPSSTSRRATPPLKVRF